VNCIYLPCGVSQWMEQLWQRRKLTVGKSLIITWITSNKTDCSVGTGNVLLSGHCQCTHPTAYCTLPVLLQVLRYAAYNLTGEQVFEVLKASMLPHTDPWARPNHGAFSWFILYLGYSACANVGQCCLLLLCRRARWHHQATY
jgi:hypothetical protein